MKIRFQFTWYIDSTEVYGIGESVEDARANSPDLPALDPSTVQFHDGLSRWTIEDVGYEAWPWCHANAVLLARGVPVKYKDNWPYFEKIIQHQAEPWSRTSEYERLFSNGDTLKRQATKNSYLPCAP